MKRKILLLAAAFMTSMGIYAQMADVTSKYIPNAGFEECEALPTKVVHDNQKNVDVNVVELWSHWNTPKGTDYEAQGWKLVEQVKNANGGVVTYGCNIQVGQYVAVGEPGPAQGVTGAKGLCFCGAAGLVYQQANEITLPAGIYRMTVNLYARNGQTSNPGPTQEVTNIRTGFMPTGGSEDDLIPAKRNSHQFASNAWDTDVLDIELTKPATGRFQICYGSSYYVVVDDIKLEYQGGVVTTALANVVPKAKALNAELANGELAAAIQTAEAFIANPTNQEDVEAQVEALYNAMSSALTASTAPVNITAAYLENASFESGAIAPWVWESATGTIGEPVNTDSKPFIDGENVVEFSSAGGNTVTQTISHLPAGYYALAVKLNGKAYVKLGTNREQIQGGTDALYLRVHPQVFQKTGTGDMVVGTQGGAAYRVDDFRLFFGKDEASLQAALLADVKADAQAIVTMADFDIVTGAERTALTEVINAGDADAINTAISAFVAAKDNYSKFAKAKEAAAAYNAAAYPYADQEILRQIQDVINSNAASAADAKDKTDLLNKLCMDYYVSNAYCEGVNKTDYTANILGANATESATGWSSLSMTVRTDKTGWNDPKTGETDAVVYGVTQDYYRASGNALSALKQTLKGLPAGDYVLSMTMMGSKDLPVDVFFNNNFIGTMTGTGTYGGMYGAGWNEYVFAFTKADDSNMPLQLQCKPEANYKEWYVDNFRLFKIEAEVVSKDTYGIVGDFSDWNTDLSLTETSEAGIYTLTIDNFEVKAPKTYEFKVRANGEWGGFELPESGQGNLSWNAGQAGFYNLTFTFNLNERTCTVAAEYIMQDFEVTYVNVAGWAEVYAYTYTWDGTATSEFTGVWPGQKLVNTGEKVDGHDVYSLKFQAGLAPSFIIFNNGKDGDTNKTADLEFENGKQYDNPSKVIPTGISRMTGGQNTPANCFNLSGQRVALPMKGLYIVGGKKVILKK